jgi:hypothetical protein
VVALLAAAPLDVGAVETFTTSLIAAAFVLFFVFCWASELVTPAAFFAFATAIRLR